MSVGGTGIPRLQDPSYIEVAAQAVLDGADFSQIRIRLVERAAELDRDSDLDGSFNQRHWSRLRADDQKYVHNTVDVLKELMRLGWVDRAMLPSTPQSAHAHMSSRFTLTPEGRQWAQLTRTDRRQALGDLIAKLMAHHPQFEGFLRVVGARPDSTADHLSVPLLRFDALTHRTEDGYLTAFTAHAGQAAQSGTLGWTADTTTVDTEIRAYVTRFRKRAAARKKPVTRKKFIDICAEAATRTAFTHAGCPMDYVTMELLRRWTRFFGLATFSYYAPGPDALRFWATAATTGNGSDLTINRRIGSEVRQDAMRALSGLWTSLQNDATSMYLPIWKVRAAVCWQQRIADDEFDRAIIETLSRQYTDLGYEVHLDQASAGSAPASTRPLVLPTASGHHRVFNVIHLTPTRRTNQEFS